VRTRTATAEGDRTASPSLPFGVGEARASRFAALSREFKDADLGQASSVLREVRAVPTIYAQVDQVLGVGGWPIDRVGLVHGESNGGKTEFALGLILSFLMRDHAGLLVDAERTTPVGWVRKLMGGFADHPGFTAKYPETYEETVDAVEKWATTIGEAKAKGRLDPDTTGIVIVDSLRKLTPKRLLEKMMKEGVLGEDDDEDDAKKGDARTLGRRKKPAAGIDGMSGRAAQYKAALNAAWMDRLTALLFQTGTGLVLIGREYEENDKAGMSSFANVDDYKVGGGKAPYFESSVVARVMKGGEVYNELKQITSERHVVQIRKTKIAGKLVRYPAAHFYVSSGTLIPYGFDRPRDVLELGKQLGSIDVRGSSYVLLQPDGAEVKIATGEDNVIKALASSPSLFAMVEGATRALFMPAQDAAATPAPVPINRRGGGSAKKPAKGKGAKKKGKGKR
jgi:RecA/RadA recombinase